MNARRSGSDDLALHGGRVPRRLGERMTRLGDVVAEAIVIEYGPDELQRRLAHAIWFQSFAFVGHYDVGHRRLKRGLNPLADELGRGVHSRQTPHKLVAIGDRVGFDGEKLATASRLVAKVDSADVQDGFDLYLHGFIVADDGRWVVVQQGMNGDRAKPGATTGCPRD